MTVLVVEDEKNLSDVICKIMKENKYKCDAVYNGLDGYEYASSGIYDVVLLDIMLPAMDGFEIVRRLRQEKNEVPILLLTARDSLGDKVKGLDCGADDYLTKPFNILELKARVRALLRRTSATHKEQANLLTIGAITLDLDARNAYRNSALVELTAKEFDVIEFLMRNPNRVYSREALLDTIWSYEYRSDIRTVDVHIRRLREKLEENAADPQYIMTKWGVGYYFRK
jgi:DNA-binding response OmpR family regulator